MRSIRQQSSATHILELAAEEDGFVVSVELILIASVIVIGLMVGVVSIRDAVIGEISDIAGAVQDINQHYSFNGVVGHSGQSHGSGFTDATDWCDDAEDTAGTFDNCVTLSDPMDESSGDGDGDDGDGDDGGGDDGGGDDDFGTPADGDLVSDNFQDGNGNAPFNLQVRNTTNASTGWTAVLDSVPYATIPMLNPGPYTYTTTMNPDGTYQYVFTGTSDLGPFQNVIITGGLPAPPGAGGTSNVDLYIP